MSISIPAFHVSDQSEVRGAGDVFIASRASGAISGIFTVRVLHTSIRPIPIRSER